MHESKSRTRERNPFEILGVPSDADHTVCRSAYRSLAKMYHPDRRGNAPSAEETRRMADLNWAWDELRRDSKTWRVRVAARPAAPAAPPPSQEERERAAWKKYTDQYRRPSGEPLGWREWIGSEVVCVTCGCTLRTWVYKCPDCGTNAWRRSRLHGLGHRLRFVYWGIIFAIAYGIAVPFLLGLLMIPPVLLLAILGLDQSGAVWYWNLSRVAFVAGGMALEATVWWKWKWISETAKRMT